MLLIRPLVLLVMIHCVLLVILQIQLLLIPEKLTRQPEMLSSMMPQNPRQSLLQFRLKTLLAIFVQKQLQRALNMTRSPHKQLSFYGNLMIAAIKKHQLLLLHSRLEFPVLMMKAKVKQAIIKYMVIARQVKALLRVSLMTKRMAGKS